MDNEELVNLIQKGINVKANLATLYQQNEGLIRKICLPLTEFCELDDLMQEAYFGIVGAVNHFDPSLDKKFVTYASFKIRQQCVRYVQNTSRLQRIPVNIQEAIYKYKKLTALNNGLVDKETVMKELKLSSKQYDLMIQIIFSSEIVSLDTEIQSEDSAVCTLADTLSDDVCIEDEAIEHELIGNFWKCLENLDNRSREILLGRFKGEKDFSTLGREYGISWQRVSQIEKKALQTLKSLQEVQDLAELYAYDSGLAFSGSASSVEVLAIKRIELSKALQNKQKQLKQEVRTMCDLN